MPRMPSWIFAIVVLILAAGVGISRVDLGGAPSTTTVAPAAVEQTASDKPVVWSHGAGGVARNGEAHWEKHGSEFPEFHSAAEYEQGAQTFVGSPPPGTLTKKRENGDTLFYNPASNTFAVATQNGAPRTMFRPNNGQAYWDRQ